MNGPTLTLDQVAGWRGPPLVLFVGISTGGSLAHTVFPGWAAALDQPWVLRGIDLPASTEPATYRRVLTAMRENPLVRGAVVTAHKLRLYRACAATLTVSDPLVELTRELNTVVTGEHAAGYANDARSLEAILDPVDSQRVVCLGAGGAATALLVAIQPALFADIEVTALTDLRTVAERLGARPELVHISGPADDLVAGADLVINATGLGKDRPGSPLTDAAPLGPGMVAWDLNYRGDLTFLRQAAARGASTMDGWDYFVAGWAGGLATIAGVPFTRRVVTTLGAVAAPHRPREAS